MIIAFFLKKKKKHLIQFRSGSKLSNEKSSVSIDKPLLKPS